MTRSLRSFAVSVLEEVLSGRSLQTSLTQVMSKIKDPRDQALLQALCYGVCRWYWRLDALLATLLEKPLKAKDEDIYLLLLLGLYQLMEMRIPDYAAISETVAVTGELRKNWAKGLVNAVLRNAQRQGDSSISAEDPEAFYAHPIWFIEQCQKDWPKDWQAILTANNQLPPLSLRVNTQQISRADFLEKLAAQGIAAHIIPETVSGITLEIPADIEQLPGFMEGQFSVQDGAAQLAAPLLNLSDQQRVLDACAAPGGKTGHILELARVHLIAVDKDPARNKLVEANLKRLQLSALCLTQDAAALSSGWEGQLFDRILLDAPCTATGVIRRHPDIKLLRQPTDLPKLMAEQKRLLQALWPALKKGGLLVYATCSIFAEENVKVIREFLGDHADAREEKIPATWGVDCEFGRQILPGMHGMDGFYYACLSKH